MGRKRFLALVMALTMLFTLMAPAFAFADGDYYLVGSMNDWTESTKYKFKKNTGATNTEEYYLDCYLPAGATFKAKSGDTWYPSGTGNDASVIDQGDYRVYFRPYYDGGEGWQSSCLFLSFSQHTHTPAAAVEENYFSPTCTQEGYYYSVVRCSVCNAVISSTLVTIDPLGHDYGEWVQTTAPNCTTTGEETRTCSRCGATQTRPVDMLGHDMVHYDAQGATCTEIGWNAYQACSRCDYKIDYEELPATGHTEAIDAAVVPTCTETGLTEGKHCSVCNAVIVAQEVVPATGHTLNHVDAVAATVNTYGNIEYWTCDVCNKYFSDANAEHEIEAGSWVIPALAVTVVDDENGGFTASIPAGYFTSGETDLEPTVTDEATTIVFNSPAKTAIADAAGENPVSLSVATSTNDGVMTVTIEMTANNAAVFENPGEDAFATVTVPFALGQGMVPVVNLVVDEERTPVQVFEYSDNSVTFRANHFSVYEIAQQVPPCEHKNAFTSYCWEDENEQHGYLDVDDNWGHARTGRLYWYTFCPDCNRTINQGYEENGTWPGTETHDYNSNHVCTLCGHVNTCQHNGDINTYGEYVGETQYQDTGSDAFHQVSIERITTERCSLCYDVVGEPQHGTDTWDDPHDWDENGVCRICHHVNACLHPNAESQVHLLEDPQQTIEEKSGDNLHHWVVGSYYTTMHCPDCGLDFDRQEHANSFQAELQNHVWETKDGKIVCSICGHVNTCTHELDARDRVDYLGDTPSYQYVDERYHSVIGTHPVQYSCRDCGLTWEETVQDSYTEEHDYCRYTGQSGHCNSCGHTSGLTLTLNKSSLELKIGETAELAVTVYPSFTQEYEYVDWRLPAYVEAVSLRYSENQEKVTVIAIKEGTTVLQAHAWDGQVVSCTITVVANEQNKAGEDVAWSFDEQTGTLTLSGQGPMYPYNSNYNYLLLPPWNDKAEGIRNLVLSPGITDIPWDALGSWVNLESISVEQGEGQYTTKNGVLFTKNGDELVYYPPNHTGTTYTVPEGTTKIGPAAFKGSKLLGTVVLLDGLTEVGSSAFQNAQNLSSITFPSTLKRIDDYAFSLCGNLSSFTLPEGLEYIGEGAFYFSLGPKELTIPSTVTRLNRQAFSQCSGIETVHIKANLVYLDYSELQFQYCLGIKTVIMEEGLTAIAGGMFLECKNLSSVTIPDSVQTIGFSAFDGCEKLVALPTMNGVETIGSCAFADTGLRGTITIPSSVKYIKGSVFSNCPDITAVTLPEGLLELGGYANTSITSINIPDSVTSIPYRAFYGCKELAGISIPGDVTSIGDSAFYGCSSLTEVIVPYNVKSIGNDAFSNCTGLQTLTLPVSLETFGGVEGLNQLKIVNYAGTKEQKNAVIMNWPARFELRKATWVYTYANYLNVSVSENADITTVTVGNSNETSTTVELPTDIFEATIEEQKPVAIQAQTAQITFDSTAANAIAGNAGTTDLSLELTAEERTNSVKTLNIELKAGGEAVYADNIAAGSATVTVPVDLDQGTTVDIYLIVAGERTHIATAEVDADHTITFSVEHFSEYEITRQLPYVAQIGETKYETLAAAFAAAANGDTVTLLADVDATGAMYSGDTRFNLWINKSITLDLDNHTLTVKGRGIGIKGASGNIDVTIKNGTVTNHGNVDGRCIDTRGNLNSLTLDGVTLKAAAEATQPLTIGGNQADVVPVTITNSTIQTMDDGSYGYAIITFNPVNMTITGSTIKGWACLNIKAASSSAGSNGSTFTITNSALVSKNVYAGESNAFGAIKVEDNNITINISGTSISINGDQNDQAIVSYKNSMLSGAAVNMGAGNNVTMTGDADFAHNNSDTAVLAISGGTFNVEVPAAVCADGYIPQDLGGGTYTVEQGFIVTFDPANGDEALEQPVAANGTATAPADPTWANHGIFLGWFEGNAAEPFDFTTLITENKTLTAKWITLSSYALELHINDKGAIQVNNFPAGAYIKWAYAPNLILGSGGWDNATGEGRPYGKTPGTGTATLTFYEDSAKTQVIGSLVCNVTVLDVAAVVDGTEYTVNDFNDAVAAAIEGNKVLEVYSTGNTVTLEGGQTLQVKAADNRGKGSVTVKAPAPTATEMYTIETTTDETTGVKTYVCVVDEEGPNVEITAANGTVSYSATLSFAAGSTNKALRDFSNGRVTITAANAVLDLNGHTVSFATGSTYPAILLGTTTKTGSLTIKDTEGGGAIVNTGDIAVWSAYNSSSVTIEGGTIIGALEAVYTSNGCTATITGGTFKVSGNDKSFVLNCQDTHKNTITVTGGTFYGFNPEDNAADGEHTNYLPENKIAVEGSENGETTWTVTDAVVVTFDADNADDDSDVTTVRVAKGSTVAEPDPAPTKEGSVLTGWSDGTNVVSFPYTPDADVTLTAQWATPVASITKNETTTYYATIDAAWAAAVDGDTITLLADCAAADYMKLENRSLTVDLNSYKLTGKTSATYGIQLNKANTALTIEDSVGGGELIGQKSAVGITADGTTLTINGGKISGGYTNATTIVTGGKTCEVIISGDSEIVGNSISGCISIYDPDATLTLSDNAKLTSSTGYGIYANNGVGYSGEPTDGVTVIIEGNAAIDAAEYFAGASQFECFQIESKTLADNGCPEQYCVVGPTGDYYTYALAVAKVNNVKYPTFAEAAAARMSNDDVITLLTDADAEYTLVDGETLKVELDEHDLTVNPPAGYELVTSEDSGVTTYASASYVAEIVGGAKFESLQAAMDAAAATGDTVQLLTDVDITAAVTVNKDVTLDLNGKTLSKASGIAISVYTVGKLTIEDSSDEGTGKITSDTKQYTVNVLGELTLESGTIEHTGTGFQYAVLLQGGASFTMNGGTVTSQNKAIYCQNTNASVTITDGQVYGKNAAIHSAQNSNAFTITGGTITSDTANFSGSFGEGKVAVSGGYFSFVVLDEYCAEGYIPTDADAATGLYTVEKGWTVTFDLNEGTPAEGESYDPQKVPEGEQAVQPVDPVLNGQVFVGWVYTEEGEEKAFDFTVAVDRDYALTAKWTESENVGNLSYGFTLDLQDSIDIPLYLYNLTDSDHPEKYKVAWSYTNVDDVDVEGEKTLNEICLPGSEGWYRVIVATFAASQMTDAVHVVISYNDTIIAELDYTVETYCLSRIEKSTNEKVKAMCRATLDYGRASQLLFNHNTDDLAGGDDYYANVENVSIPVEFNKRSIPSAAYDLFSYIGMTLSLESRTEIDFYLIPKNSSDQISEYTFMYGNRVLTATQAGAYIRVAVDGISAPKLNDTVTLTCTHNGTTVELTYSALSYAQSMHTKAQSQNVKTVCKALYNYYLAADALFN